MSKERNSAREDGVVVLRGMGRNKRVITPEERRGFGFDTEEMVREYELYEPDPNKAQRIIDHLNSEARREAKENEEKPGQHSMISTNTFIYPSRNGR